MTRAWVPHRFSGHAAYQTWKGIIKRCTDPARWFGVSLATVNNTKRGIVWRDVP